MSSPRTMSILTQAVQHDPRGARMAIHRLATASDTASREQAREALREFLQGDRGEQIGALMTAARKFHSPRSTRAGREYVALKQASAHPLAYSPDVGIAFQGQDRAPIRSQRLADAMATDCIALIEERLRDGSFKNLTTALGIVGQATEPRAVPRRIGRRIDNDTISILMEGNAVLERRPHSIVVQLTDNGAQSREKGRLLNSLDAVATLAQQRFNAIREDLPPTHALRSVPVSVRAEGSLSSSKRNKVALKHSIARRAIRQNAEAMAVLPG